MENSLLAEAALLTGAGAVADTAIARLLEKSEPAGWPTPGSTTAAVYALLLHEKTPLLPMPAAQVRLGNLPQRQNLPRRYFFTTTIAAGLVHAALGNISVSRQGHAPLLTLVHWAYSAQTGIEPHGLALQRQWWRVQQGRRNALTDGAFVALGDTVEVQLVVDAAQALAQVVLSDGWPAGFELLPQPGEKQTKAVRQIKKMGATEWLLTRLPAGRSVFTYRVKAVHAGSFYSGAAALRQAGSATFRAREGSVRINIE